ncbi:MAG: tetratricopeptide repeat protein [Christensenellales bacterium]
MRAKKLIAYLGEEIRNNPHLPSGYLERGLVYESLGLFKRAEADYEAALKLHTHSMDIMVRRAVVRLRRHDIEGAKEDFNVVLERRNDPEALFYRALLHFEGGKIEDAIADYTTIIDIDDSHSEVRYNRGRAYHISEKFDEAEEDYKRAYELEPGVPLPCFELGQLLYRRGEYEQSIKQYNTYMAKFRSNPHAYNSRGESRLALGLVNDAISDFTLAIRFDNSNAEYYLNRAEGYIKVKKQRRAGRDLNTAIRLGGGLRAFIDRGRFLADRGRSKDAIEDYEKALKLAPENAELKKEYEGLLRDLKDTRKASSA